MKLQFELIKRFERPKNYEECSMFDDVARERREVWETADIAKVFFKNGRHYYYGKRPYLSLLGTEIDFRSWTNEIIAYEFYKEV